MLKLEVIWKDSDLIECKIQARSGSFAAEADIYFTAKRLSEFADIIAGFPKGIDDRREFHTVNSSSGNHFRLSLECVDAAGHGSATTELIDKEDTNQNALIRFSANAGDVDSFENALRVMSSKEEGVATLG